MLNVNRFIILNVKTPVGAFNMEKEPKLCKLSRNLVHISKSHSESSEGTHTQLPSTIVAALTFKHHRETIISRHTHLAPHKNIREKIVMLISIQLK